MITEVREKMKQAMKDKDKVKKGVLSLLLKDLQDFEKENKRDITSEEAIDIVAKTVKKTNGAIEDFEKAKRTDLVDQAKEEIKILMAFLPAQMDEKEIIEAVEKVIAKVGATTKKEMGKVMGALQPIVKGKADNKLVSKIVRERLQ